MYLSQDHLSTCRLQIIANLLGVAEGALSTGAAKPGPAYCRSNQVSSLRVDAARTKARADCNAVILGSLVQELAARDLFPAPAAPEDVSESAPALQGRIAAAFAAVQTLGIPAGSLAGTAGSRAPAGHVDAAYHVGCNPSYKLLRQLDEAASATVFEATAAHVRHLDRQAKLIGEDRGGL